MQLRSLIRKIRTKVQRHRSLVLQERDWKLPELDPIKHDTDKIQFLATKAGVEWLVECHTNTAHFYL